MFAKPIRDFECLTALQVYRRNWVRWLVLVLPVQFAHRNHNWLEKSAQSKLFLCEAEIRLFRRYLYDRNQFVKY